MNCKNRYICILSIIKDNSLIKKYLFFLLFLFNFSLLFSQLSKTHYIPPVTGVNGNSGPGSQILYISTPSKTPVTYIIRNGDENETPYETGQVSNGNPKQVIIANDPTDNTVQWSEIFVNSNQTELVLDTGFIIEAESEIYVSFRFTSLSPYYQAGALVSKGVSALGTRFRAGMLQNQSSNHLGFISVMATENNTTVDFDLKDGVQTTGGQNDHSVTLNKFQSYFITNTNNLNSLIGSLVKSDKPIVVNVGSFGSFSSESGQDYGMDQIVDATLVGSEYIFVKGIASNTIESVLIVADQDNTAIKLNDEGTIATLNSGDYLILKGNNFNDEGNLYISTDNSEDKIFAYQGTGRDYTPNAPAANQAMYFVPPLNCATKGNVDEIPVINEVAGRIFQEQATVSFITKDGATILINGNDVTGPIYNASPRKVDGNRDYVTYKVENLSNNVTIEGNDELYVAYVNSSGAATTAGFYSGFTTPPTVEIDAQLKTLGSCLNKDGTSNIEIQASNFSQFDEIKWMKKEGSNLIETGEDDEFFTPNEEGIYVLKGILLCNNKEYLSSQIVVSICPNDSDNDGIIDNIDLDLDNDGILNSVESAGTGLIDFSDPSNPSINIDDGSVNGNVINGMITGTITKIGNGHTITNASNGFESQVEPGSDQELKYTLNFNEKLNILFKDSGQSIASVNGESFILKSLPESTNITLLDPDGNLYVDTNYDGVYEENIIQFTSNEIRFKFKTRDNTTYEFYAYQTDGIELTHKLNNVGSSSESIIVPSIFILDYKLDTDNDSILDYLDIDSDSDGCNDVTEAGFDDGILIDGILGDNVPTFDNSQVDSRGRVINHDYQVLPLKDPVTDLYYFQQAGQAVEIIEEPTSTSGCIGDTVSFNVNANHSSNIIDYQWQFFDTTNAEWINLDGSNTKITGFDSKELIISDIDMSLAGDYRVQLKTEEYQCIVNSNLAANIGLTVNSPPNAPIVEPIQTFCLTDSPTVGDLQIDPSNPTGLTIAIYDDYDPNDSSIGNLLDVNEPLVDGTTYFIQVSDSEGCVSVSRSETKVLLPDPLITPSVTESCPGDEITITVSGVPQTALDFELANPTLTKVLADYTDNSGRLSSYFVDPVSRSFSEAEDLLPTYGIGASMYQINDPDEHDAVFNAIQSAGLAGVPLWLGLKQFPAANPGKTFNGGWKWLDGRDLDPSWNLWEGGEPNDYEFDANCNATGPDNDGIDDGSEDYGHFNLSGNKLLNDYPDCPDAPSRPVYEFRGTTTVNWYYEDPKTPGTFIDIPINASTLTLNPEVTTTYFIDVTTNGIVCSTSYTHVVNPLPVPNPVENIELCDEVDSGDPDSTGIDGISYNFDLETQTSAIVGGQVDRDGNAFTVSYHETKADAESGDNPITSPYTNVLDPSGNLYDPQTIYVRLLDNATGCYDATETFDIIVNPTPVSNTITVEEVCDDVDSGSDVDGSSKFDLTLLSDEILGPDQVAAGGFIVTYHLTQAEAEDPITYPNGIANPSSHYNTPDSSFDPSNPTIQTEEIFVRITDTNASTLCYIADSSFTLTVNPLPVILNPVWKVEQCDNPLFDLTDYNEKLSTFYESETFTYFDENGDEILISDAENYTSSSTSVDPEIIDVVFTKNDGGCFRSGQIELKVSYSQVPNDFAVNFIAANQEDLFKSDTDPDLTGQSQDGKEEFSTTIFENIINELKAQSPLAFDLSGINFEFYGSERDATLRNNPIDITQSTYTNQTETPDISTGNLVSNYNVLNNRWEQDIWVYIENTNLSIIQSSCIGLEHVTTLYVEKRPVIYDVIDASGTQPNDVLLLCDEQITLDGYSIFDTSTLQDLLLGNTTDPSVLPYQDISTFDIEYSYIDDSGNLITSSTLPSTINLTNQKIDVTLTNNVGVTAPFVSSSSVSFQVFETPTPFSDIVLEECDDTQSGTDDDGKTVFSIDIDKFKENLFIDPLNPTSAPVQDYMNFEYSFSLYDKNDLLISGPSTTLNTTITAENGDYIMVDISNPISEAFGKKCVNSIKIDFVVNPLPSFDIDNETIVCLNPLPDNPIEIGTSNWNGSNDSSIYNYYWSRTDLNGIVDSSYNETTETIKVDKGGVYEVIVEDVLTKCIRTKSIKVTESEIAKISLDDITIEDLKNDNTNSISIDTLNLGIGIYEFSLDDPFGPYQDQPKFESVKPGIHTIYIRDKNSYYTFDYGCGIAQIDVSVVGYKKYFTPNGDGINETWKVLGIRSDFNANSKVYIFDRFGKLLKELDPLTEGWDGTYLGKPMPATDYWFRTYLEDGREFKGHFSLIRGN